MGKRQKDKLHIAGHVFYLKKNVNLTDDNTKNPYAGTSLLEDRWQRFANSQELSLPCFLCNRNILNPRPGSRARYEALSPGRFSLLLLNCVAKAFLRYMKIGLNKRLQWGFAEGTVEEWVWLVHAGHFPGASPLLAGAPALAVYGNSPHNS